MARDDPQMKIRLPEELKERIDHSARGAGRTLNAEVVARLQESLDGTTGLRLPEEILKRLHKAAKETGRTVDGELFARMIDSLADRAPAEVRLRAQLDAIEKQNAELRAELEQAYYDTRLRSNTLYVILDANGRPISWAEVHAILEEIRELGGIQPREMHTTVVTPDMESSSRRIEEVMKVVQALRSRDRQGPALMESGLLDLQTKGEAESPAKPTIKGGPKAHAKRR